MNVISLPSDLIVEDSEDLQLYDYQISEEQIRNQISLSKNTFSFLQEGTKEVFTQNHPVNIQNTEFLIIRSGNCLMTENISAANSVYRSILFFFSDEMVQKFLQKHQLLALTPNEYSEKPTVQVRLYDHYILSFVESLKSIYNLTPVARTRLLQVKFEEIMLYLAETQGSGFLRFLHNKPIEQREHLVQVVEANALKKLSVAELAFLANTSISTFKREFEKYYGSSPSKWFQQKRLEQAAFMLKEKKARPSDIFEEVGYESLSTFIQAFKSKFGVTPKQFQLEN